MTGLAEKRDLLLALLADKALRRLEEPVELSSGFWSCDFFDVKSALSEGKDLRLACETIADTVKASGIKFDAIGGPSMGAAPLAIGVAALTGCAWFLVRKEAKGRGTNRKIEGAHLNSNARVLLVEDVVTTGASILRAFETVYDISNPASWHMRRFVSCDHYYPMTSYQDFGIEPVGAVSLEGNA